MKKLLSLAVILGMFFVSMAGVAQAATSERTFNITITIAQIEFRLDDESIVPTAYTTWGLGERDVNTTITMIANNGQVTVPDSEQGVRARVGANTTVPVDLKVYVSNVIGGWSFAAAAAADTCVLEVQAFDAWQLAGLAISTPTLVDTNIPAATLTNADEIGGMGAEVSKYLYFRLRTPTGVTPATSTANITVTVRAFND